MTVGIIAEYNPFHNGHLYHIQKIKEKWNDCTIVLVLGGNFLQRGDASILNKWTKTEIALNYGVDLVIELPFPFATQSADIFARGVISILNALNVDYLVFGSESDDIESLKTLAEVGLYHKEYIALAKLYLNEGKNYPTALSLALKEITGKEITLPNDILGLTYVKEIMRTKSKIIPLTIKRKSNYHSSKETKEIASASSIRQRWKEQKDISHQVPKETKEALEMEHHDLEDYFPFFQYKVLSEPDLKKYQTVDEGIENKLKKEMDSATSFEDLLNKLKTKRYTHNRLKRMFVHILVGFTKEEWKACQEVSYLRILGFTEKGKMYLNKQKKKTKLPILSKFSSYEKTMLPLELRATKVYAMTRSKEEKKALIKREYTQAPLYKKERTLDK